MHLIFTKDSFIGFSNKTKLIDKLKKERPFRKFIIKPLKEKLNSELLNTPEFSQKELKYFDNYERVFFNYEITQANAKAMEYLITLVSIMKELAHMLQYIKFEKSEIFEILKYIEVLQMIKEDLLTTETCVFLDDYFSMTDILDIIARGK